MEAKLQEKEMKVFHCTYCKEKETWAIPSSQKVFGMNNVGVCKFWKFLSIHNKLDC